MSIKFCLFKALYLFSSTSNLFKYFRRRYDQQLVREANYALRLKSKCVRTKEDIRFIKECLARHVTPSDIAARVKRDKPKNPSGIERAFMRDELDKLTDVFSGARVDFLEKLAGVCRRLSLIDRIRFAKLVNKTASRLLEQVRNKKDKTLHHLEKTQLGIGEVDHQVITNLSSVELSEVQKNVLARGLNFGIPPKLVEQEVKAEFELCWSQLRDLPAASTERRDECKATLSSLARKYANSKVDRSGFPLD